MGLGARSVARRGGELRASAGVGVGVAGARGDLEAQLRREVEEGRGRWRWELEVGFGGWIDGRRGGELRATDFLHQLNFASQLPLGVSSLTLDIVNSSAEGDGHCK